MSLKLKILELLVAVVEDGEIFSVKEAVDVVDVTKVLSVVEFWSFY